MNKKEVTYKEVMSNGEVVWIRIFMYSNGQGNSVKEYFRGYSIFRIIYVHTERGQVDRNSQNKGLGRTWGFINSF